MKTASFWFALLSLIAQSNAFSRTSYDALPAVKKGGNYNDHTPMTPLSLNPLLITDVYSSYIADQFFMALFGTDGETNETYPELASKVEVSKDKKEYTYTLNPAAKWSDGTSVTSDDIAYTFERLMDPKVEAAKLRGYYDGVHFTKIDQLKFKFHVDEPKFNTEIFLNGFAPIQKNQFEKETDFNKNAANMHPVASGPYRVKSLSRDQSVVLEHVPNWWGRDLPQYKARFNFDTITYKIIPDPALAYEKFIRGEVDAMTFNADQFVTQVMGKDQDRIGKSPKDGKLVWAAKLPTHAAMSWSGLAVNLKNPLLASLNTRKGLAYLIDYEGIIQKAYLGTRQQCVSPFGSNSENTDPALKETKNRYRFDPKVASTYFTKDGWKQVEGEPFLMKTIDGKATPFRISVKYYSNNSEISKSVTMLKESFKRSGVDLQLKPMDGTALYKDFDDRNFEMLGISWQGGSLFPDPKQLWSSESMEHGSNKVAYSNTSVDALIKKANLEFDRKKRSKLLQEIGRKIYEDVPYLFLAEQNSVLQGLNSRIKSPKWIEKYGVTVSGDLFHE